MHNFVNGKFYIDIPDGFQERFDRAMKIRNYICYIYKQGIDQEFANLDRLLIPGKCVFSINPKRVANTEELLDYVEHGGICNPPHLINDQLSLPAIQKESGDFLLSVTSYQLLVTSYYSCICFFYHDSIQLLYATWVLFIFEKKSGYFGVVSSGAWVDYFAIEGIDSFYFYLVHIDGCVTAFGTITKEL